MIFEQSPTDLELEAARSRWLATRERDENPIFVEVEGYKAFRGGMVITPKILPSGNVPHLLYGDWLYKPETDCWYGGGWSYPSEICEIYWED